MNRRVLKQTALLSLFLGAILGIITVIPYVGNIAFWILMCLTSVIIILFMMKLEMLEIKSVQESAVLGAIIGFISFIGFSVFYIPIIVLMAKIFQFYPNYGISIALSNASFGLIIILVLFMGVLSATLNAFFGFLTYYGIDLYKVLNANEENEKFK